MKAGLKLRFFSVGVSLLGIILIEAHAQATGKITKMDALMATSVSSASRSEVDSLELVGTGVSVETWRNHPDYPKFNIWTAIEQAKGAYIVAQDQKQYPNDLSELRMLSSKRNDDAIDGAMREFMDQYPLPIAVVGPAWHGPEDEKAIQFQRNSNMASFVITTRGEPRTSVGSFSGLLTQSGQVMNSYLNDNPDLLWQTIFTTFDTNGDIPAVGVAAKDSMLQRAVGFQKSDKALFDKTLGLSYRPKQARILSDNWTFLTMVRRGRVDWLRPYAPLVKDTMTVKNFGGDPARNTSGFDGWLKSPPKPFVPTRYIAQPWTSFQLDQYDHLENLGTLYRPQVVSYLDADGKPVSAAERVTRMEAALRAALAPLGGKMPARILYDYGSVWDDRTSATRFLPLVQSVHAVDAEFDLLDTKRGYDLARILGDTGAGSPFVAVALASMAGRQSGGPTLVANLRRDDGATLMLVTPPSAEQVKKDAAITRPFWPRKYK
jgi:hypothetical protein